MNYEFTIGPWSQDQYGNVITPNGQLVSDGVAFGQRSTKESRANAKLIAAAPCLLKALTDLRDAIEAGKETALGDANRAIRKAGAV